MSGKKLFHLFYYSQIPLVLSATLLTTSVSVVLYSKINWAVVLLVGLSTYLTYSIDNLIDWNKDRINYRNVQEEVKTYHRITYFVLPVVAIAIILLILKSSNEFLISILLLGALVAMGTTRFAHYRENSSNPNQPLRSFLFNRFFISTIWTTVSIFVPIWYDGHPITPLTWHTFFYIFCMIFVYAVLWKLEKSPQLLKKRLFKSKYFRTLIFLPIISIIIVILDIVIEIRPIYNLVNLLPSVVTLFVAIRTVNHPFLLRQKVFRLTISLLLATALSVAIELILL